uniref:Chemokine (C-X-C motif) ligand 18a, duplicate 1 n=1 Tax=Scleropages formosus TaxID=113540 RepID=A0A8C9TVV1_SCLFO
MDYRSPAAVLIMLVLLCGGDLNTAMSIRERCECLETVDKLTWRQITDFQVTPRSELCNSVQITNQKVCLNPESRQGKKIQNCWNRDAALHFHRSETPKNITSPAHETLQKTPAAS